MFAACSSEETPTQNSGGVPINFTANIQNLVPSVVTRVADGTDGMVTTSFPENSEIRLGEGNPGTTDSYITNSSSSWTYTSSSDKQYLPYDKDSKRIVAFFPAPTSSVSGIVNIQGGNVSVSSDQSSIDNYKSSDLLGAIATVTKDNVESVSLNFKHLCSKVIVNVKNGSGNVSGYTITMKNIYTTAAMPLSGGNFTFMTNYFQNNGSVKLGVSSSTEGQAAIIIPQTIAQDVELFEVTKDDVTYTFTTTESITLKSGYSYTFDLKFENTEIGFGSVTISNDWGTDPDKSTPIEGTLSEKTT